MTAWLGTRHIQALSIMVEEPRLLASVQQIPRWLQSRQMTDSELCLRARPRSCDRRPQRAGDADTVLQRLSGSHTIAGRRSPGVNAFDSPVQAITQGVQQEPFAVRTSPQLVPCRRGVVDESTWQRAPGRPSRICDT